MQLQILVAVGVCLSNIIHPAYADPVRPFSNAIRPSGNRGDEIAHLVKGREQILERDEWIVNMGNGWAGYYQTWESYIPVQLASAILTNFYSLIVDRVQGSVSSLGDPAAFQAFEWDNLRLEFSSDAEKIPWAFIATFAARMAASTQRGFTGQFNAVYVHMATEQSIRISLTILQNAARVGRGSQNF